MIEKFCYMCQLFLLLTDLLHYNPVYFIQPPQPQPIPYPPDMRITGNQLKVSSTSRSSTGI